MRGWSVFGRNRRETSTRALAVGFVGLLLIACGMVPACGPAEAAEAEPALYWSAPAVVDNSPIVSISCPSTSFCVGVDMRGNAVASTNPTGGSSAWTTSSVDHWSEESTYEAPNVLYGVSCPSPAGSLCVAIGQRGIFTSSEPAAIDATWAQVSGVGEAGRAVSCASATSCVAGGPDGKIFTSTDPLGGPNAWSTTKVAGASGITGLSCPSETLCVAVDESGDVLTSDDPTGNSASWTVAAVDGERFSSVSCPATSFCVADGEQGVMSSTDPGGGAGAWALQRPGLDDFSSVVACASASLCIVSGSNGEVTESTYPSGGSEAWTTAGALDGAKALSGVACPSETLCFAADEAIVVGVPARTLSVELSGAGRGLVTSTGIACPFGCTYSGPACPQDCGVATSGTVPQRLGAITCSENELFSGTSGTCALSFPSENLVTLTATAASGSTFAGWSGACSDSTSCSLSMSASHIVDATFAVSAVTPPTKRTLQQVRTALEVSHVSETHADWREDGKSRRPTGAKRLPPIGTKFRFKLNSAANVTLAFFEATRGRLADGRCVEQTKANAKQRSCSRMVSRGTIRLAAHKGLNTLRFNGRIPNRKRLGSGTYEMRISAAASGKHVVSKALHFTIAHE